MLQDYQKEEELLCICECGAVTSSQRSSFESLPKVLILHLKRFRFTEDFQVQKIHHPVVLCRDLVISSNQGAGCYSLVSVISHHGSGAESGHYISDGLDQNVGESDPSDRWFTYDDARVTETTGASACEQRIQSSYILFYKRHLD
ncbi:ubiquitin hydrolase B-like [Chaetodon trifascialis]|uniref:ubiquitin hydrolase B-like n=1 Tax=Chaetodon trifascialis TaxID=109706 RepID=UPI0039920B0B